MTQNASEQNKSVYERHFNKAIYEAYGWICGYEVRNALYFVYNVFCLCIVILVVGLEQK